MELDKFLLHIFGELPDDQVVGIVQRGKDTKGWQMQPYKKGRTKLRPDAATYYCISTLKRPEPGEPLRRLMENLVACRVIVLDDIGTKIAESLFKGHLGPHYIMETSPGNTQWAYKVVCTLEEAQVLIEALIEAGYSDPGARDVHRLVRLPGSLNYKHNPPFASRITEDFLAEAAYTYAEMVEDFGLTPREPTALRASKRVWNGDTRGDVILKWLVEKGMVLSEPNADGWVFIECPWAAEHSDGRTDAKYQIGNGATGSARCFHGACQHRTQKDFHLWCKENGAPDFEEEATKNAVAIAQRIATVPKGVFGMPVIPMPPDNTPAGDILIGLVHKYAPLLKRHELPSCETMAKGGQPKDIQKPVSENVQHIMNVCGFGVLRNHLSGEIELTHPDRALARLKSPEERSILTRELLISLAQRVGIPLRATLSEMLYALAGNKGYHPIMDWIEEKPWDGVDRVPAFLDTLVCENTEWRNVAVLRWCIQCIVAWTNWQRGTPLSISQVLILVGIQGIGKSSWFGRLLPAPWRRLEQSANLGHANSKDDERRLTTTGLVEMSEFETIVGRVEAGHLKSFVSRPMDRYRLPYDRHITERPRCTPMCASVNDEQFLSDPTGARRYWPVEVKSCDYTHNIDMQQFWAQMLVMFKNGERWHLSPEELVLHALVVDDHRVVSNAEGRLEELKTRMMFIDRKEWTFATPSDICRYYGLDNNYMNSRTAGGVLSRLFGKRVSNNGRKGWYVPLKTTELISGYSPYIVPEKK